jgi:hypothetical protein
MPSKAKTNLLRKLKQKFLRDGVERSSNVHLEHEVFFSCEGFKRSI